MESSILKKAARFLKGRKKYAVAMMGVLAATAVGFETARPALTLEREVYCGLEEHTHTAECYAGYGDETAESAETTEAFTPVEGKRLNCTVTGPVAHTHGEGCFGADGVLVCSLEEKEAHTHTGECFGQGTLTCGKEETGNHTHTEECYTVSEKFVCGKEESEAHIHDGSCYGSTRELTCEEAESEGHSHTEGCYDEDGNIVCGQDETEGHTHTEGCYTETGTGELICGKEETEGHTHTEGCYEEVKELVCGKEETEGHTHTAECYEGGGELICGKEELEEHVHGDGCFSGGASGASGTGDAGNAGNMGGTGNASGTGNADGIEGEEMSGGLICGKEEHVHTEECYDPKIMLLAEGYIDGGDWWELSQDGVLSIHIPEGEGPGATMAMADYGGGGAPWYKYREQITSVVIGEGVTGIGSYAFYACAKLSNVGLPDGMEKIGSGAFRGCTSLEAIHLPEGMKAIENIAFSECSKLSNVKLPDGMEEIGSGAFEECASLETIELPEGIKKISKDTFYNSGLKSVAIPESVESIEQGAFGGCKSLSTVVISPDSNLTTIAQYAFRSCKSLESITIPEKVTDIAGYAFQECSSLQEIVLEAVDLEAVRDSAFPNNSQRRLIVKCDSVNKLSSVFLSCWPVNDVRFEGSGHFQLEAELSLGDPMRNKIPAGNYYGDGTGALYSVKEGEAALSYVPEGVEKYTVLGEIPSEDGTGNIPVVSMKSNALKMADDLAALEFQSPENIRYLPAYSCGNCSSLKTVNGMEDVEDIRKLFVGEDVRIDFMAFHNTGLKGWDDLSGNGVIELEGGAITIETLKADDPRGDGWTFYTGQRATTTVSVSNWENMADYSVVRCYITFDEPRGILIPGLGEHTFGSTIGNGETGKKYTVNVCESDAAYTYYYEISKLDPGETLTFDILTTYPNITSGGGTARIWAVALTEEERQNLGSGVTGRGAENHRITWDTRADEFEIAKDIAGKPKVVGNGEEGSDITVTNLEYRISMHMTSTPLEGVGKDHMLSVDFADTLRLPEGMKWREGLLEAVEAWEYIWKVKKINYQYYYILYAAIDGEEYEVFRIRRENGIGYRSPSVVGEDNDAKRLQINWSYTNSKQYEMNMPVQQISFGNNVIVIDINTLKENSSYKIDNYVEATQHYTYSEDRKKDALKEYTIEVGESDFTVYKSATKTGNWGNGLEYTVTISNSTSLPYKGLERVEDKLSTYVYLGPENMKTLFGHIEEGIVRGMKGLQITIENATLCKKGGERGQYVPGKEVTGTDGQKHILHQGNTGVGTNYGDILENAQKDPGMVTEEATVTIYYYAETNKVKVSYAYGGEEKTLEGIDTNDVGDALESIGYLVTSRAQYTVNWEYEDDYALYSGAQEEILLPVTIKDSFMLLEQDTLVARMPETFVVPYNKVGVHYEKGQLPKTATEQNYKGVKSRDFQLRKGVEKNGEPVSENGSATDRDILKYTLYVDHKGEASYDIVPLVDRMQGAQILLIPVEGNGGVGGLENLKTMTTESDGKVYYLLNQTGVYRGITLGGCLTDSIEVKEEDGGLDTMIRWYLADIDGEKTKTISYDAIVDASIAGDTPGFSISNTSWLNDHQSHRLYDNVGLEGTNVIIEKNIVTDRGDSPLNDKLEKYSPVMEGRPVTYRLEITNVGTPRIIKGADIYDILPDTAGFSWIKGENVEIQYSVGGDDRVENGDRWAIEDMETEEGKAGGKKIQWGEDFALHLKGTAYIYVTLTYPEGEQWQSYAREYGAETLENTFYCYRLWDNVFHELSITAEAYLQKGVAYTSVSDSNNTSYNKEEESRLYYSNKDQKEKGIGYCTVLYNSGDTRLYLNELQDKLPKGFTFKKVDTSGLAWTKPLGLLGADGKPIDVELKRVEAAARSIGDGKIGFTLSGDALQYDEFHNKYYLAPGQAVYFRYCCDIGEYADTEERAVNQIAMPYTDITGGGLIITEGIETDWPESGNNVNVLKNTGSCEAISSEAAADKGFEDTGNSSQWMVSDVEVRRGEILPGITKKAVSTEGEGGVINTNPYHATAGDTINWEVTATNIGRGAMVGYTLTDIMESPYSATGAVRYEIYDAEDKRLYVWTLFEIEEWITDSDGGTSLKLKKAGGSAFGEECKIDSGEWSSNLSGKPVTLREGSTLFVRSERDDYFTKPFEYEVRFQTKNQGDDKKREEEVSITFKNRGMAIPEGGKGVLIFPTKNTENDYLNKTYTNTCYITPEQSYKANGVNQGVQVVFHDKPSVRNRGHIQVTYGVATRSVKEVEEIGNTANRASSEDNENYILLPGADSGFRYTLQVENLSDKWGIEEMVLIDGLPQPGDHNPFTDSETRDSQFTVRLADDPQFKLFVEVKDNAGNITEKRELSEDQYTLEYSRKAEFSKEDWTGGGSWESSLPMAEARSFRITLKDTAETKGDLIPIGASVVVQFNGQTVSGEEAPDGVAPKPGATAWNSFGYHYKFVGNNVPLEATPLNVGVRIPDVPRLTKELTEEDGGEYRAKEDGVFRFLIYTGNELKLEENFTEAELAKALTQGNREYSLVDVEVKEGASLSDTLVLDGLKAWEHREVSEGTGVEWEETQALWEWQDGATYTIVELPLGEEDGYRFGYLGGFRHNGYTFRHQNKGSERIIAVNTHEKAAAYELPESGGGGTGGYTLLGCICLLATGLLLGRKRQRAKV